jgi:hypothetical protein
LQNEKDQQGINDEIVVKYFHEFYKEFKKVESKIEIYLNDIRKKGDARVNNNITLYLKDLSVVSTVLKENLVVNINSDIEDDFKDYTTDFLRKLKSLLCYTLILKNEKYMDDSFGRINIELLEFIRKNKLDFNILDSDKAERTYKQIRTPKLKIGELKGNAVIQADKNEYLAHINIKNI